MSSIIIRNRFSKTSSVLRQEFQSRFQDTGRATADRFVWDYWNHKGIYCHLRTPATEFFSQKNYLKLHKELVMWGRKNLGCWDISPPWLSCYTEGHYQDWHTDVPHGPWAFVLSLTTKNLVGGETTLLNPLVLNYWKNFSDFKSREQDSLLVKIKPQFNRLIVFDPRIPHSVSKVEGAKDLDSARLVLHGWFTEPKTYIDGFLPKATTETKLNQAFEQILEAVNAHPIMTGVITLGIQVNRVGRVTDLKFLTNNLITVDGDKPRQFLAELLKIYSELQFSKSKGTTKITLPLIFQ